MAFDLDRYLNSLKGKYEVWWNKDREDGSGEACRIVKAKDKDKFVKSLVSRLMKRRGKKKWFTINITVRPADWDQKKAR